MGTYDTVVLASTEQFYGQVTHLGSIDTITAGRGATALNMTQNGHARIQINGIADFLCDFICITDAFGNDNHVVSETMESCLTQFFDDILFKVNFFFGNQNSGCAYGKAHIHSQETGITAHNFNDRAAFVGLHSITKFVDAFNGSICSGIKANAVIGTADVVINSTGNTDNIDAMLGKGTGTTESTIAANGNNAVQSQELTGGNSPFLTFFGHKLLAACSIENGTAAIDSTGYAAGVHFDNIAVDQTIPATTNTIDFNAMIQTGTHNCTDGSIHTGGIATTGKYTDTLDTHVNSSC